MSETKTRPDDSKPIAPAALAGGRRSAPRGVARHMLDPLRGIRPAGYIDLGLKGTLSDRLLPILVAAMTFLAALALAGFVGASALAEHWQLGAEATLTVQVPQPEALAPPILAPGEPTHLPTALPAARRVDRAMAVLRATPGIASVKLLTADDLAGLLRPWLGTALAGIALPMPAVIDVRLGEPAPEMTSLAARLDAVAPGTLAESHGTWVRRLLVLARSLQACTGVALMVVVGVAAAMVGVATRAGLAVRRESIEVVHGLGATDGYIAGPFAWRAMFLAALGGVIGAVSALPVMLWLTNLALPFIGLPSGALADPARAEAMLIAALPPDLWAGLLVFPLAGAAIGWLTAQVTVRRWLRQLP